ncbi:hypothetical protein DAPPUDRAFT_238894 [Daphnia pulex]|uniref:Uncharacterized protein n=1 Tax=Daphnia pulex TaxID=6669 RepID=E9G7Q4_DAPPU|nr:hypothetical protein DAPPUDRAFT_238894 [Daphnia pulex]|eukprot:EFX84519.1 hypothetical protein DAPPUDRAFT_238894 [Daphnia pulex]
MNPLSGDNVLHAAARGYGEYEPLQNYPRDVVNAPNLDGETPLITAVKERNFKASLGILRLRPDINVQDCKGNTVLHHTVHNHDLAVTGRLCEAGAETCILNKEGKSCLNLAAVHADVATLRRLFKKKLEAAQDVYIRDFLQVTSLIDATKAGNLKKIHELVRRKGSVLITDDQGNTPLHWVVIHNIPQTAARLAKANKNLILSTLISIHPLL